MAFADGPFVGQSFNNSSFDLPAGTYNVGYGTSVGDGTTATEHFFPFTVSDAGLISYDSSYSNFFKGSGTSNLVISGLSISIISKLSEPVVYVEGISYWNQSGLTPQNLVVLPGQYSFGYNAVASTSLSFVHTEDFIVNNDGTISYAASAQSAALEGSGTNQLVVKGFPINIVSTLSPANVQLAYVAQWVASGLGANGYSLNLLPGAYAFGYSTSASANAAFLNVIFTVGTDGKISYDSSYNNLMSGSGSTKLTVSGLTENILSLLTADGLNLSGIYTWNQSTFGSKPNVLQLLPGKYVIGYFAGSTNGGGTFNNFEFAIASNGAISVDPSLLSIVSPNGNSLTINGALSSFDLRHVSGASSFILADINDNISTGSVATLALLPGNHAILAPSYNVDFKNDSAGAVVPDPTFSSVQTGSGTPVLVYGTVVPNPPTANAGPPFAANAGQSYTFDGAASKDPKGLALSYAWDFGDGSSGSGVQVAHTYANPGRYSVVLTVTNSANNSATAVANGQVIAAAAASGSVLDSIKADLTLGLLTKREADSLNSLFAKMQSELASSEVSALNKAGHAVRADILKNFLDFNRQIALATSAKKLSSVQAFSLIESTLELIGTVDNDPQSINLLMMDSTVGLLNSGVITETAAGSIGNALYKVALALHASNPTASYTAIANVNQALLALAGAGQFPLATSAYFVNKIKSFDALVGPNSALLSMMDVAKKKISSLPVKTAAQKAVLNADNKDLNSVVRAYLFGKASDSDLSATLTLIEK